MELLAVVRGQSVLHPFADLKTGDLQMVIGKIILFRVKDHVHLGGVVHVVGEADLPQTGILCRQRHLQRRVVSVKGNGGMHMVVKHLVSPLEIGGTPWAERPQRRSVTG